MSRARVGTVSAPTIKTADCPKFLAMTYLAVYAIKITKNVKHFMWLNKGERLKMIRKGNPVRVSI
jgi:hypothetical protein